LVTIFFSLVSIALKFFTAAPLPYRRSGVPGQGSPQWRT